jgi:hypothetical protein
MYGTHFYYFDTRYYLVVHEPSTELILGFTLVNNYVRNRSHMEVNK